MACDTPRDSEHVTLPEPFDSIELPLHDRRLGKVRVSYAFGSGQRLFVTTDRLSAFDRIIARVPYKGQVLNQLAAWWFEQTADIVPNHVVSLPDPNLLVAREAAPLSVEVVVRGHISGVTDTALWTQYAAGARNIYGHEFPDGLTFRTLLPKATSIVMCGIRLAQQHLRCSNVAANEQRLAGSFWPTRSTSSASTQLAP